MKKILAALLSVILFSSLAISGTVAYLTDTDSDTNTFTMGKVDIIQHEQERDSDDDLVDFKDRPLFPMIGDADKNDSITVDGKVYPALSNANVRDKVVTVQNVGKSRAFVRSFFAFEADKEMIIPVFNENENESDWIYDWDVVKGVLIGDTRYDIHVAYYNGILNTNSTTEPSLLQVGMHHFADNDYVAQFGETYNVLVASQAVQCEGFIGEDATTATESEIRFALNEAFGPVSAKNHPWFTGWTEPEKVSTAWYDNAADGANQFNISTAAELAGLAKLVNEGKEDFKGKTISLSSDIDLDGAEWEPIGQTGGGKQFLGTFDGKGHTISNLKIHNISSGELASTGGFYATGLFGFIDAPGAGNTVICNLNVNGADVRGHHYTGVIAGYLTGMIQNCTVSNANVLSECVATAADGPASEPCGDKAGAIAGFINDNGGWLIGCSAANCNIRAARDAGQLVGASKPSQVSDDCSATNVEVFHTGYCFDKGTAPSNINKTIIGRVL